MQMLKQALDRQGLELVRYRTVLIERISHDKLAVSANHPSNLRQRRRARAPSALHSSKSDVGRAPEGGFETFQLSWCCYPLQKPTRLFFNLNRL